MSAAAAWTPGQHYLEADRIVRSLSASLERRDELAADELGLVAIAQIHAALALATQQTYTDAVNHEKGRQPVR